MIDSWVHRTILVSLRAGDDEAEPKLIEGHVRDFENQTRVVLAGV
jgi:hypothetical protein